MDAPIGDDEGLDDDFDDMDGNDLDDDGGSAPRRKSEKAKWSDGEVSFIIFCLSLNLSIISNPFLLFFMLSHTWNHT